MEIYIHFWILTKPVIWDAYYISQDLNLSSTVYVIARLWPRVVYLSCTREAGI